MRKRKYRTGADANITDLESYFLNGPVKQVMETRYKALLQSGVTIQGKIETDGSYTETNYITTYNKQGGRIHEDTFGSGDSKSKTYNNLGLEVEEISYQGGQFYGKTIHVYTPEGHHLETIATDKDGAISHRRVNTLNELGQVLEAKLYYGKEEKLYSNTVYEYEEPILEIKGRKYHNLRSLIEYKGDGTIDHQTHNKYNEQGKVIESKTEYSDEKKNKDYGRHTAQKYNKQGDCIEYITYNADGSVKSTSVYTHEYDNEGKLIVPPREPYDPFALATGETEEIETDHHDNWTKKTTIYKNKPTRIILRQYSYYGEPSEKQPPFVHPVSSAPAADKVAAPIRYDTEPLDPEQVKWMAEGASAADPFPMHRYYVTRFKEMPSIISFTTPHIEAFAVLKKLEDDEGVRIVHSIRYVGSTQRDKLNKYILDFPKRPGYILVANSISGYRNDEYEVPSHIEDLLEIDDYLYFSQFTLYRPDDNSTSRDEFFEESLQEYMDDCTIYKQPEKPFINIVETSTDGFTMAEYPVDDDFEIRDLDVNYGYGFQKFHDDLIQRFNKSTKGLVLFHGEPGTGKTYYIRHLLRKMVTNNKVVIYMPPNMVDHLVEPAFMTFLASEVREWSAEGNFCVLLIEDAEPLLAKRQEGVRIQGVTNLLNLSDGLLNDMLNLQIICTFNVDLKKLDSALLRPGRLIARKEFKALGELDANLLASRLGIKHHFTGPATLSEIYSMRKNQNTLIHDVAPDRDASTILDDL